MVIPKEHDRGFFAIGIENAKTAHNVGTLWRTADLFGAAFIFTIGKRYHKQSSDTMHSYKNIPLFTYTSIEELVENLPYSCPLVGVELDDRAQDLKYFCHPERAVYLLGAEDSGMRQDTIKRCHALLKLPGRASMNVAVAGSMVIYDRYYKLSKD